MSKPTILFINRVYPPVRGATGRLLKDLAQDLALEGWDVTVISSGACAGEEQENGVRIIRIKAGENPKNSLSYMLIWIKMLILGLRLKPRDVLVTLSDPPMLIVAGSIIEKFKKCRHINWCHDLYPDIVPVLGIKMPRFLLKKLKSLRIKSMKSCDKIVVCGSCMKKHVMLDGIEVKKISVIPNWANWELTDSSKMPQKLPNISHDTRLSRPFGEQFKNKKRFQILYAGNIGLAHPIDIVLEAAKILEERESDVEFVFVGDGARFDYIAQRRAEMCLDNIRILPHQPASRLREVMEGGDIHLITMKNEAQGLIVPCKFYSALAVARPCIFVGAGGGEAAKTIKDFGAGLIVKQDDAQGLVDAVLYFRSSRDAWFDAHEGALRAREMFNPKASIDKFMKQIQSFGIKNKRRS